MGEEERNLLQLKVCSSRKIASPINAFVQVELGGWSRQTTVKKHTDRPIWNETFVFPVDEMMTEFVIQLKHRDALGKISLIGKTSVSLPKKANELMDIWVVLDSPPTDVHLCMQLEPLGGRSLDSILHGSRVPSARSSLIRFGAGSFRLLSSLSSLGGDQEGSKPNSGVAEQGSSSFAVKAGAVTLTEICQALDRLRGVIYLAGNEGAKAKEERQKVLQAAKVELDELSDQIEEVDGLSDEWKDKLELLIEDYAKDCWKMLSDESWANLTVRRQSRVPPPLPSKETLNKIRQERLSLAVDAAGGSLGSRSPPPPSSPSSPSVPVRSSSAPEPSGSSSSPRQQQDRTSASPSRRPLSASAQAIIGMVRDHFLTSLEAFDAMIDFGFVVELPAGHSRSTGKQQHFANQGDLVTCKFTAYVFDGAIGKAVAYDSTGTDSIEFILGETHEDIPRGLMAALKKIPLGQTSSALVTITPEWGFGDDGHEKGVPPNSNLLFDLKDIQFTPPPPAPPPTENAAEGQVPQNSPAPADSSLFKLFGTFPAREPAVVLDKNPFNSPEWDKWDEYLTLGPSSTSSTITSTTTATAIQSPKSEKTMAVADGEAPKRKSLLRSFSSSSSRDPAPPATTTASVSTNAPSEPPKVSSPPTPPRPQTQQMMNELSVRLSRRASRNDDDSNLL